MLEPAWVRSESQDTIASKDGAPTWTIECESTVYALSSPGVICKDAVTTTFLPKVSAFAFGTIRLKRTRTNLSVAFAG